MEICFTVALQTGLRSEQKLYRSLFDWVHGSSKTDHCAGHMGGGADNLGADRPGSA
jgi:hypothetical protein